MKRTFARPRSLIVYRAPWPDRHADEAADRTLGNKGEINRGLGGYAFFDGQPDGYADWLAEELARQRCDGAIEVSWKKVEGPGSYSVADYPGGPKVIDLEIHIHGGLPRLRRGAQRLWGRSAYLPSRISIHVHDGPQAGYPRTEVKALASQYSMEEASWQMEDWDQWAGKALYHAPKDLTNVLYGGVELPPRNREAHRSRRQSASENRPGDNVGNRTG